MIDRDKILVPANWDSWGKIRIIREGFDMEGASTAWSIEIQDAPEPLDQPAHTSPQDENGEADDGTSAVTVFEQTIQDPKRDATIAHSSTTNGTKVEIDTSDTQGFLMKQVDVLEQLKADDEKDRSTQETPQLEMSPMDDQGKVNEHIGPVQFNMGGIQVDADDMLKKLRVRTYHSSSYTCETLTWLQDREANRTQRKEGSPATPGDEKAHNQALANFFAGLVKKPSSSPRGSPSA